MADQKREKREATYVFNGALIAILFNKLATSEIESEALLFGS